MTFSERLVDCAPIVFASISAMAIGLWINLKANGKERGRVTLEDLEVSTNVVRNKEILEGSNSRSI
jgi:hypothetical protein